MKNKQLTKSAPKQRSYEFMYAVTALAYKHLVLVVSSKCRLLAKQKCESEYLAVVGLRNKHK